MPRSSQGARASPVVSGELGEQQNQLILAGRRQQATGGGISMPGTVDGSARRLAGARGRLCGQNAVGSRLACAKWLRRNAAPWGLQYPAPGCVGVMAATEQRLQRSCRPAGPESVRYGALPEGSGPLECCRRGIPWGSGPGRIGRRAGAAAGPGSSSSSSSGRHAAVAVGWRGWCTRTTTLWGRGGIRPRRTHSCCCCCCCLQHGVPALKHQ